MMSLQRTIKNKNIRDLYRGINYFKKGYQPRSTLPPSMSRMSENVGASTYRNPKGLHGLYRDNFTLPT
jgi:hypothetical protein